MLSNLLSALEKPLFKPLNKVTGTNKNRYPFGYLFLFITYAW